MDAQAVHLYAWLERQPARDVQEIGFQAFPALLSRIRGVDGNREFSMLVLDLR